MACNNTEELFSKICRICLSVNISRTVPLFETNGLISCYGQAISLCTKLELPHLEYAPSNMCYACLHQLRQCILFQKKCTNSQNYFKQITTSYSQMNIKENLIKHLYRDRNIINDDRNDKSDINNHNSLVNNDQNDITDINNDNCHITNDHNYNIDISIVENENSNRNNEINASSNEVNGIEPDITNKQSNPEITYIHVEIEPMTIINENYEADNDFVSDNDSNYSFNELFDIADNAKPENTTHLENIPVKKENKNQDMLNSDKLLNAIGEMIKTEVKTENKQKKHDLISSIKKNNIKPQQKNFKNIKKIPNILKSDYSNPKTITSNDNDSILEVIEDSLTEDKSKETEKTKIQEISTLLTEKTLELLNKSAVSTNINKRVKENKQENNEVNLINLIRNIENKSYSLKYIKPISHSSKPKSHTKTDEKMVKKRRKKKVLKMICDTCSKEFASKNSLVRHLERHAGVSLFVCELCGKGFVTKAELGVHLVLTHDTGRHYPCDICGYKAPRLFDLTEHKRIHTGERPFSCDKCGLTFRRRYVWQQHQVYHTEKTLQCSKCPLKFHRIYALRSHENCVHERKYVYNCPICGTSYAQNKSVRRHMVESHGVAREKQGKIERVFVNSVLNETSS